MIAASTFLQSWLEPVAGHWLYAESGFWTVIGFLGAAIFGSRFVLQWLQTEKEKKLVVPWHFWHLSFWGSVLNFIYFLHLDKAPLILGNCFLPFLYGRNILFLRAGGERGRGRLVFAGVAVLVVVGFGISAILGNDVPKDQQALKEMQGLASALKKYKMEFGTVPAGDSRAVADALHGNNEKKIRFVEDVRTSPEGAWLDPWGQPYRIYGSGKPVLIRCAGPNGTFDEGNDEKRDDILVEAGVE